MLFSGNSARQSTTHTLTNTFFPDLKSVKLTPGVPTGSIWDALPLADFSTRCLSAACFIFVRNQSAHHQLYYVFVCTHCAHKTHALRQSHIQTNRSLETTQGPCLMFLMANKVQRQTGIIWQRKRIWQCVFGGLVLLTPASEAVLLKLTLKARVEE